MKDNLPSADNTNEVIETIFKRIASWENSGKKLNGDGDIVVVLGVTGVGKGTLINYLNNPEVKIIDDNGVLRLDFDNVLPGITISHSTVESDTFDPGIYSPKDMNFSYIDFSGFNDTREGHDIVAAYFRQKLIESAQQIKVLLVVPYNDFITTTGRGSVLRDSFDSLNELFQQNEQQTNEQQNFEELSQSIGLVVTKADAPRHSPQKLEKKLEAQIKKLNKLEIKYQNSRNEDTKIEKKIGKIKNKITEYERKLAEAMQVYENCKSQIEPLSRDYKFEIFSKPINKNELVQGEQDRILKLIKGLSYVAKDTITVGLSISSESKNLVASQLVPAVNDNISNAVVEITKIILNNCNERIKSSSDFVELSNYSAYILETLNNIIEAQNHKLFLNTIWSIENVEDHIAEISKHLGYLTFFGKLNEILSENNLLYVFRSWGNSALCSTKKILNEYFIDAQKDYDENSKTVTIKGIVISAMEVMNFVKDANIQNIEKINICALNTIFLDKNLVHEKLKGVNLTIIAPIWKVIGDIIIDVSGKTGSEHVQIIAEHGTTVWGVTDEGDGLDGISGHDGIPGNPGKNGGNLICLGGNTLEQNIYNIMVNTNGGNGGPGQYGGNGSNGSNSTKHGSAETVVEMPNEEVHLAKSYGGFVSETQKVYKSEGGNGGKGGDGGKGGVGGKGGYHGSFIYFCNNNKIVENGNDGEWGISGYAGDGGLGGNNGITYIQVRNCTDAFTSTGSKMQLVTTVAGISAVGGAVGLLLSGMFAAATGGAGSMLFSSAVASIFGNVVHQEVIAPEGGGLEGSDRADSGRCPKGEYNNENIANPQEAILPDPEVFIAECIDYYYDMSAALSNHFIDTNFMDIIGQGKQEELMYTTASPYFEDTDKAIALVEKGANPFHVDNYGDSPFSVALNQGKVALAKEFIWSKDLSNWTELKAKVEEDDLSFCVYIASNICRSGSFLPEFFGLLGGDKGTTAIFAEVRECIEALGYDSGYLLDNNDYI